jgi:Domain of unknown function (DUF6799)
MKNRIVMLISLAVFSGGAVMGQDQDRTMNQDKDIQKIQKRDRIHQEDHLIMEDGRLYQYRAGVKTQVKDRVRLNNGTTVNPDGTCQLKNKEQSTMKNGQCLDMAGNKYQNRNKFNKNKMMSEKQMNKERMQGMHQGQNMAKNQNRGQGMNQQQNMNQARNMEQGRMQQQGGRN